jgi:hypothetical protein
MEQPMKKPLGLILYKGPSKIDGQMIIVLATGFDRTQNEKTGDMIQTWIMTLRMSPIEAKRYGHDFSVCGDCKHKHIGSCYVNIAHGPHNTYRAYMKDRYTVFNEAEHLELFKGRKIRLGSYGDPAAVPTHIWKTVCDVTDGHTGYTHQWNTHFVDPELKKYAMASADNESEYHKAKSLGWRAFRVRMSENDAILENEFVCPASKEGGVKTSCTKCKACMGLSAKTSKDPVIIVHGLEHKIAKFKWGMQRIAWKEKYRIGFDYPIRKKKKRPKKRKKVRAKMVPQTV